MQSVDNGAFGPHEHSSVIVYISSESYLSAPYAALSDPYAPIASTSSYPEPLSTCELCIANQPLSTIDDYYDIVDWNCSLAPYVDKLYWKIDGVSQYEFPNNVMWERG